MDQKSSLRRAVQNWIFRTLVILKKKKKKRKEKKKNGQDGGIKLLNA